MQPANYPVNIIHLWRSGSEEAVLQVQLKPGRLRVEEFKERLRQKLPRGIARRTLSVSSPATSSARVMSFGSPTPVQVAVSGTGSCRESPIRDEAARDLLAKVPSLRDLRSSRSSIIRAIKVDFDRERQASWA